MKRNEANTSINLTKGHTILMFNEEILPYIEFFFCCTHSPYLNLFHPYSPSPPLWLTPLCHFLPHPPPFQPPPTTLPLSSVSSLYGSSNTTYIAFPFLFYLVSYPTYYFFSSTNYLFSFPNISSSRWLYRILILDVALRLCLQNQLITLINKLMILPFLHILLHHLLLPFNNITYTWNTQNRYGFAGE